ncbi:MAG: M23 family metallopeptidase, partial [Sandaracinaceae bacterium]|nr:M23 family metallopeptidase [Sandaracinaceae bacterium]
VPLPDGEAAERAERLRLGTRAAVERVRLGRPPRAWAREVGSSAPQDLLWPVARGLFSRGFGFVRREEIRHRPHLGVDIVAEEGARIRAANDGLVVYADNGVRGYGNLLAIVHADRSSTFYGHCRAIYVAPGEIVSRGQVVGEVGHTGLAERPHLHFEWHHRGDALDPMPRFVERPRYEDLRPNGGEGFEPPPPNAVAPEELENENRLAGSGREEELALP